MPVFGEQALGVELHAFDGVIAVADAHNGAVFRPRRDVQMLGQAGAVNHQAVIARANHRVGQAFEHA